MDSEAHFSARARASDYGVPAEFMRNLARNGITTLGHLAFAVFRPGAEFEEAAFDRWVTEANGGVPLAMGPAAAIRRLHFEAEIVITCFLCLPAALLALHETYKIQLNLIYLSCFDLGRSQMDCKT